jgi:drug/metabolite transporter (DMT)-like permease
MVAQAGVAYALVAGVAWGVVLYASKRHFAAFHPATFMALAFGCAAAWYAPVGLAGSGTVGAVAPRDAVAVVVTVALLVGGLYLLFRAISMGEVSYVAPVSKVTPAFVVPIEVGLLAERLVPLQVVGVLVTTAAVYVANYEGRAVWVPLRRAVTYRPGQLALASAFVLAWLNVSQRVLLQELGLGPTTWIAVKLAGGGLLLAPLARRHAERDAVAAAAPQFVALGALLAVGEHCIGQAFALRPASVVTPVVSVQSIVAVLLGGVALGEERFATRLAAAVAAVAGIALVGLA